MKTRDPFVLTHHRLRHLPRLMVGSEFFEKRFSAGCSVSNCNAECCRYGAMVDVSEREAILGQADLVRRHLEPHQERDPRRWFEDHEARDADFPSGRSVGTSATGYGCVFLDSIGRCVLQKAETAAGLPKFSLKPFFCAAYPVTIEDGMLMIDEPDFVARDSCCSIREKGALTALDVCAEELDYVLGTEGVVELRELEQRLSAGRHS